MNEAITLIKQSKTTDAYGDTVITETSKQLLAEVKSAGRTEFYQGQAVGYKPEYIFVIADYLDYSGEEIVKYKQYGGIEDSFTVIKTYRTGNALEITVKRGIE